MQLGIPEHKVASELARFAAEGLLAVISAAEWDRRKLYQPSGVTSAYWRAGYELVRQAAAEEALRADTTSDDILTAYLRSVHPDQSNAI